MLFFNALGVLGIDQVAFGSCSVMRRETIPVEHQFKVEKLLNRLIFIRIELSFVEILRVEMKHNHPSVTDFVIETLEWPSECDSLPCHLALQIQYPKH